MCRICFVVFVISCVVKDLVVKRSFRIRERKSRVYKAGRMMDCFLCQLDGGMRRMEWNGWMKEEEKGRG